MALRFRISVFAANTRRQSLRSPTKPPDFVSMRAQAVRDLGLAAFL